MTFEDMQHYVGSWVNDGKREGLLQFVNANSAKIQFQGSYKMESIKDPSVFKLGRL